MWKSTARTTKLMDAYRELHKEFSSVKFSPNETLMPVSIRFFVSSSAVALIHLFIVVLLKMSLTMLLWWWRSSESSKSLSLSSSSSWLFDSITCTSCTHSHTYTYITDWHRETKNLPTQCKVNVKNIPTSNFHSTLKWKKIH